MVFLVWLILSLFFLCFLIERLYINEFVDLGLLFLAVGAIMTGFASVSLFIRSNSVLALCTTLSTGDVNLIVALSTIKLSFRFL